MHSIRSGSRTLPTNYQKDGNKMKKKFLIPFLAALAVLFGAVVPQSAKASYPCNTFAVPGYPTGGLAVQNQSIYCLSTGETWPGNYQHIGNAEYFLAYTYNFPYTKDWARNALGATPGINTHASPTSVWTRYNNLKTQVMIYWLRPDNRTFCWAQAIVYGADYNLSSQGFYGECGPY